MSAKWKEEVDKLYERRMKLERSQKKLLAENKDLKLAQQQRENAGRDPLERYLFDQRRLVYAAEQRISRMEEIVQFAPRDVSQKRSLDWKRKVDDYMDGIGAELDSVLHSHDTSIRLLTPEIPIESDLGSLMTCAFGMGNWEQSLKSCDLKFGARAVVKSLVLAALQIWVFLTAFPNFNPKDMQKIEAIWEAVLDQGV